MGIYIYICICCAETVRTLEHLVVLANDAGTCQARSWYTARHQLLLHACGHCACQSCCACTTLAAVVRVQDGLQDGAVGGRGRDVGIGGLRGAGGGIWQRRGGVHHVLHTAVDLHVVQRARKAPFQQLQLPPGVDNSFTSSAAVNSPAVIILDSRKSAVSSSQSSLQDCWVNEAPRLLLSTPGEAASDAVHDRAEHMGAGLGEVARG
jgi:hypothetical protein